MALDPYIARGMPDLGANALAQVQQGRENKRRNAMLALSQSNNAMAQDENRRAKAVQTMGVFLAAAAKSQSPSEFVKQHAQPFAQGMQEFGFQVDPNTLDDNQVLGLAEKFGSYKPANAGNLTTDQSNYEYAMRDPAFRKFLEDKAPGQSLPAVLREWDMYNKLPPADQARYLEMKRTAATPATAEALSNAKQTGKNEADIAKDLPQAKARLSATTYKMDRLGQAAQSILDDKDLWQAVGLGQGLAYMPASGGARVKAKIEKLKSQAAFVVLQDMRDSSKTGGAVGQVSNYEEQMLMNNLAALDQTNVSPEDYRSAVQEIVNYVNDSKQRFADAFYQQYPALAGPQGSSKKASPEAPASQSPKVLRFDAKGNPVP